MADFGPALTAHASSFPETTAGVACKGTAIERPTVCVRKKAFLFLGDSDLRLKLGPSLPQAQALAADNPDHCSAGKGGWVKLTFSPDDPPDLAMCKRWAEESYRLMAPKKLVKQLDGG